jgi:hypothetical protein
MPDAHDDAVREQFRLQAATFTDQGFAARGLDWIRAGRHHRHDRRRQPGCGGRDQPARTLRDPSHGRTLTLTEIHAPLADAGAAVPATASRDHPLDLEDWMNRTGTPRATRSMIRVRINRELDGGEPTGLRPHRDPDGSISLNHVWATVTATPIDRGGGCR